MEEALGAVVAGIGILMLGVAYLWLAWVLVMWAVEAFRDPKASGGKLVALLVFVFLFPASLIILLVLPFLERRRATPPSEGPTSFPI